ncbi:MAG: geranylgeranylglyceryl/heptaprenylglyceryl phosphate synthase [Bacteroidota bacterium]
MRTKSCYSDFLDATRNRQPLLAILVDPDKFDIATVASFARSLPPETTHIFVGGSTVPAGATEALVRAFKEVTAKPVIIFPGDFEQITPAADALLFLSLYSGRNPEYLIGQQVKSVQALKNSHLEVIATGYILIDGGHESAVARVTQTSAMPQEHVEAIVDTAVAATLIGARLIYLEAGSGAQTPVAAEIISAVRKQISVPLLVGGGIRSKEQMEIAYAAGANMVVMGTHFEENHQP